MANYLYNGVELPDINAVWTDKETYPYAAVITVATNQYLFFISSMPFEWDAVTNAMVSTGTAVAKSYGAEVGYTEWVYDSDSNWVDGTTMYSGLVPHWSNYDILNADGSIYLTASDPVAIAFILPDGTELPALPEGCFEKYPYGMISYVESTNGEAAYALSVAEGTYIFAPGSATGEGSDYVISLLPGYRHYRYVVAPTAASGWEQYAESTTQHSGHDFSREDGTIEIRWCNHDILTATAMNDDGTPEIGPDLYRKSDVNYRIYGGWLNSMGNQARRLGNVSGALKPGEMETVFKGVTAGGGDSGDSGGSTATVPAESAGFGVPESEYGIVTVPDDLANYTMGYALGWRFTVLEEITVIGLRHYIYNNGNNPQTVRLWENTGKSEIANAAVYGVVTEGSGVWAEALFASPVTLEAGKAYTVSAYTSKMVYSTSLPDYNSKISYGSTRRGEGDVYPTISITSRCPMVDIIIGDPTLEKNYTVQRATMDAIANQVKRITGQRQSMTASEMASALSNVPTMTT